jgi:molecular chaperone GrpE (heat shock protein)
MLGEAEESEEMEDEKEHLDIADLKAQIEELKKKLESLQA